MISSVSNEQLSRQLPDDALHLKAEQRDTHRRTGEAAHANDLVDGALLVVECVISLLLILTEFQRRQHTSLAGRRWFIAGWKQVFKFAQYVLCAFAEFRAFLDKIVTPLAAWRINASGYGKNLSPVFGGKVCGD